MKAQIRIKKATTVTFLDSCGIKRLAQDNGGVKAVKICYMPKRPIRLVTSAESAR